MVSYDTYNVCIHHTGNRTPTDIIDNVLRYAVLSQLNLNNTIYDANLLTWNDNEYYYDQKRTCVQFSSTGDKNCNEYLVCAPTLLAQRKLLLEALDNDFGLHPFCPETNLPICGEKLYLELVKLAPAECVSLYG